MQISKIWRVWLKIWACHALFNFLSHTYQTLELLCRRTKDVTTNFSISNQKWKNFGKPIFYWNLTQMSSWRLFSLLLNNAIVVHLFEISLPRMARYGPYVRCGPYKLKILQDGLKSYSKSNLIIWISDPTWFAWWGCCWVWWWFVGCGGYAPPLYAPPVAAAASSFNAFRWFSAKAIWNRASGSHTNLYTYRSPEAKISNSWNTLWI